MTKRIIAVAVLIFCIFLCALAVFPKSLKSIKAQTKNYAAKEMNSGENSALSVRFLNMLNHNYAVDGDFQSSEKLISRSAFSLSHLGKDGLVDVNYVKGFMRDMYGIEDAGLFPEKTEYVKAEKPAYEKLNHKNATVNIGKDGKYTVVTDVVITKESREETKTAVSYFEKNGSSPFGFKLVFCKIQ